MYGGLIDPQTKRPHAHQGRLENPPCGENSQVMYENFFVIANSVGRHCQFLGSNGGKGTNHLCQVARRSKLTSKHKARSTVPTKRAVAGQEKIAFQNRTRRRLSRRNRTGGSAAKNKSNQSATLRRVFQSICCTCAHTHTCISADCDIITHTITHTDRSDSTTFSYLSCIDDRINRSGVEFDDANAGWQIFRFTSSAC